MPLSSLSSPSSHDLPARVSCPWPGHAADCRLSRWNVDTSVTRCTQMRPCMDRTLAHDTCGGAKAPRIPPDWASRVARSRASRSLGVLGVASTFLVKSRQNSPPPPRPIIISRHRLPLLRSACHPCHVCVSHGWPFAYHYARMLGEGQHNWPFCKKKSMPADRCCHFILALTSRPLLSLLLLTSPTPLVAGRLHDD